MAKDSTIQERVQELTWSLVDDDINDDEMSLLDSLLLSDDSARKRYIDCVRLHADLMLHFSKATEGTAAAGTAKSPVLGFLHAGTPQVGYDSPPAEELKS